MAPAQTSQALTLFRGRNTDGVAAPGSALSLRCREMTRSRESDRDNGDLLSVRIAPEVLELLGTGGVPRAVLTGPADDYPHMLSMLGDLARLTQTGPTGLASGDLLIDGCQSLFADCRDLQLELGRIRRVQPDVPGPLETVAIEPTMDGWMDAMAELAVYRSQLKGDRIGALTSIREPGPAARRMSHQFTALTIAGRPSPVMIHNCKARNGAGATRVMSLVRPTGPGTWAVIPGNQDVVAGAFARGERESASAALEEQIAKAQTVVDRRAEGLVGVDENDRSFNGRTRALNNARATRDELVARRDDRALPGAAQILDLSYDDICVGLGTVAAQQGLTDADTAAAMLTLIGQRTPRGLRALMRLDQAVAVPGIKVKDLVNPRDGVQTGTVTMRGTDLCNTMLSIMFLTEPKHALPMAVANVDALKLVAAGKLSFAELMAPLTIDTSRGEPEFRLGTGEDNIGAALASANNLGNVVDPAVAETRALKVKAMPTTEEVAATGGPADIPRLALDLPDTDWATDDADTLSTRQAAVLAPLLKAIVLRSLVKKHGL